METHGYVSLLDQRYPAESRTIPTERRPAAAPQGAVIISGDATIHFTGGTLMLQNLSPGIVPDLSADPPRMSSSDRDRSLQYQ